MHSQLHGVCHVWLEQPLFDAFLYYCLEDFEFQKSWCIVVVNQVHVCFNYIMRRDIEGTWVWLVGIMDTGQLEFRSMSVNNEVITLLSYFLSFCGFQMVKSQCYLAEAANPIMVSSWII